MPDPQVWLILIGTVLVGSIVGGVAGFGTGLILLPVLAWTLGARAAVPVLTVTMVLGNLSRLWWSRYETDLRVVKRYLLGAIPATVLGAVVYAVAPTDWLSRLMGIFLLGAVPLRRLLSSQNFRVRLVHFPFLGAAIGFLSSLVVATGPVLAPFFLAYGLRRGAFIATESVCAFAMHVTRGLTLASYSLLSREMVAIGLTLGSTMFLGSWIGRRILDRMSDRLFLIALEALLVGMGLQFLLFPR